METIRFVAVIAVVAFVTMAFLLTAYQGECGGLFYSLIFATLGLGIISIILLWILKNYSKR